MTHTQTETAVVLQNPDGSWRLPDDPTSFTDRETAIAFKEFRDAHTPPLPRLRLLPDLPGAEYDPDFDFEQDN